MRFANKKFPQQTQFISTKTGASRLFGSQLTWISAEQIFTKAAQYQFLKRGIWNISQNFFFSQNFGNWQFWSFRSMILIINVALK